MPDTFLYCESCLIKSKAALEKNILECTWNSHCKCNRSDFQSRCSSCSIRSQKVTGIWGKADLPQRDINPLLCLAFLQKWLAAIRFYHHDSVLFFINHVYLSHSHFTLSYNFLNMVWCQLHLKSWELDKVYLVGSTN